MHIQPASKVSQVHSAQQASGAWQWLLSAIGFAQTSSRKLALTALPIYTLLSSPEPYTESTVKTALQASYGSDLAERVWVRYVDRDAALSKQLVQILIIGAAADVRLEDLGEHAEEALEKVRRGPGGKTWLEVFAVDLDFVTRSVEPDYLRTMPRKTMAQKMARVAVQKLAEIESCVLWRGPWELSVEPKMLRTDLRKILSSKTFYSFGLNSAYLDFIRYARIALAAFLTGATDRPAFLKHFEASLAAADGPLLPLWQQLHAALLDGSDGALRNCATSLWMHWEQSERIAAVASEAFSELRSMEYVARRIGYLNEVACAEDLGTASLTLGTMLHLEHPLARTLDLCHVKSIVRRDQGFVCHLVVPCLPEASPAVYVTFQGTIKDFSSYWRDTTVSAPGYKLWKNEGFSLIADSFFAALADVRARYPGKDIPIIISGHSLGASDALNCLCAMARVYGASPADFGEHFGPVYCYPFNAPGIKKDVLAPLYVLLDTGFLGRVTSYLSQDDIVQRAGEAFAGSQIDQVKHWENTTLFRYVQVNSPGSTEELSNHSRQGFACTSFEPHRCLDPLRTEALPLQRAADRDLILRYLKPWFAEAEAVAMIQ